MREDQLIQLLRERGEEGVEALLQYYGPLMRYVIAPILPDPRDREECLWEVAMRVWQKIHLYDPQRGSWNSWLTALTRNTALNRAQRLEEQSQQLTDTLPDRAPTPEESLLHRERQEELQRAIQRLSPGERMLFYRRYYYLQPISQIARELGLTQRAAEGRLYRLKKRLYHQLKGGSQ